jgi:hypothetical protein
LHYTDGAGSPDAEAVTTVRGDDAAVYVGAERDSDEPNDRRNSVLRYETTGTGALRATQVWELDAVLPTSSANAGIEGLTWIADEVLVSMGLRDQSGKTYTPAEHPGHGSGLFVVGHEQTGSLSFVALRDGGAVTLVASMASGLQTVMEVVWHDERRELWALCDDGCGGRAAVWKPAAGAFELVAIIEPPSGMASLNNEGFALSPRCVDNVLIALWSDDGATNRHALREADLPCSGFGGGEAVSTTRPTTTVASPPADAARSSNGRGSRTSALVVAGIATVVVTAIGIALVRRRRVDR